MTMEEFKKRIYDTVEPMLDGQGIIKFKICEPRLSRRLVEIEWRDAEYNEILADAYLSYMNDEVFAYCIVNRFHHDIIDARFDAISRHRSDDHDSKYCLYHDFDGVEATLQAFTEWLVKTVHDV